MDEFVHVRTIVGIILGLSITHIVQGIVKLIAHPTKTKVYWVQMLWVAFLFLLIVHFWWWEFSLRAIHQWTFLSYIFLIIYATLFYATAYILSPHSLEEYEGYRDYYYSRKKWVFSILGFIYLMDLIDTEIKGIEYLDHLGAEYYWGLVVHILLCLVAILTKKEWIQVLLAVLFLAYQISWIDRVYFLLK